MLQQDPTIPAHIDIDKLVSKHFAVLGTTGVGKSNGVAILLQQILDERPNLRIFLIDPHNEYGRCFGDKAQVLTPRNLRLPFWLFNFEETVDAFFGGRPGVDEEVEILSEVIPLAKAAYVQLNGSNDRALTQEERSARHRLHRRHAGAVPHRRSHHRASTTAWASSRTAVAHRVYHKPDQRIQTFRNHPRYAFMFENATVGGDTMAEILGHLFRLPTERQADDHHAARRLPGRGGGLGRVRALPHGVRLRPVERRRLAAAVRLRRGAPLRAGRQARSASARPAARCRASPRKAASTACSSAW